MAVIKKTDNLEEVKKNSSVEMKKKLVKKQNSKLKKIFAEIPSDRKTICESLIQNVAFMIVELNDLQDQIHEHGMVEEYQNGENQCGTKPSSAAQIYNATLKSYNTFSPMVKTASTSSSVKLHALKALRQNWLLLLTAVVDVYLLVLKMMGKFALLLLNRSGNLISN